jgi:hypothetical protein
VRLAVALEAAGRISVESRIALASSHLAEITMRLSPFLAAIALGLVASGLEVAAHANALQPGDDLFHTEPGTSFDFSQHPVPADFFGPGSLPFEGRVNFVGQDEAYPPCDADPPADTIFLRPVAVDPPDTTTVLFAQLSLVSTEPIVVRYAVGPDRLWNVHVGLAPVPAAFGTMILRQESVDGGTFDLEMPEYPLFTFTNVDGDSLTLWPTGVTTLTAVDVPWRYTAAPSGSCRSNFCPAPSGPMTLSSAFAVQVVSSLCPTATSATAGEATAAWGTLNATYR